MEAKKKLLLIAYRAYGDHLYWSPLIPVLTEKYDVYLETNSKGYSLFMDDPRFKQIAVYTEYENKPQTEYDRLFAARWEKIREQVKPDIEINLNGTLEVRCIGERYQEEFHLPVGERRAIFGVHGFYDAIFERVGIKVPDTLNTAGLYFTEEQEANLKAWRELNKDSFQVIIPIAGTTAQKVFHSFSVVIDQICSKYPDAKIWVAGDELCSPLVPNHPQVRNVCGSKVPFKQAVLMTKYADMVIGPETGLLVAAGMFGTPKIILATTSSVWQMTQYQVNDFSIQAPIHCSPCHRAIYYEDDCETPIRDEEGKFVTTACSKMFRVEDILQRVDYVYQNLRWGQRNGE